MAQPFASSSQFPTQSNAGRPRPRCLTCGSKKWTRDGNRGEIVCEEGHVLEGYIRETNEITEWSNHQLRKRRFKVERKRKRKRDRPEVYYGERARFLLLQALTLLLRRQLVAVEKLLSTPPQVQETAKEMWEIYLTALNLDDEALVAEDQPTPSDDEVDNDDYTTYASGSDSENQDGTSSDSFDHDSSSDSSGRTISTIASRTASSMGSQDSGSESDVDSRSKQRSSLKGKQKAKATLPRRRAKRNHDPRKQIQASFTLCIVYLACLVNQCPILTHDLFNNFFPKTYVPFALSRHVADKRIPFLDFYWSLPVEMTSKMNHSVRGTLFIRTVPSLEGKTEYCFAHWCSKLAGVIVTQVPNYFGQVKFLTVNTEILVRRCCNALNLPPIFDCMANHFLSLLPSEYLQLNISSPGSGSRGGARWPATIDFYIMATVLATTKLVYGLDGTRRLPPSELEHLMQPEVEWLDSLADTSRLPGESESSRFVREPVGNASLGDIDDYLAFCETFLLDDFREMPDYSTRARLFPKPDESMPPQFPPHVPPRPLPSELNFDYEIPDDSLPSGRDVRIYAEQDCDATLPPSLQLVLTRASAFVGSSEERMLKVCGAVERRWRRASGVHSGYVRPSRQATSEGSGAADEDGNDDDESDASD